MKRSQKHFGMKGIILLMMLFISIPSLFAQSRVTISGTVVDENNLPMMGVGVIQKGTTTGVATDLDGKYSLTVPSGVTIVFSSVGYVDQEFVATKNETVDVVLVPDTEMI